MKYIGKHSTIIKKIYTNWYLKIDKEDKKKHKQKKNSYPKKYVTNDSNDEKQ